MPNRFRSIDDHVYRVVGVTQTGRMDVLQGPYANRAVAKGQATAYRNDQIRDDEIFGIPPKYVRIFAQETVPVWTEI